jgi:hypothetical protein
MNTNSILETVWEFKRTAGYTVGKNQGKFCNGCKLQPKLENYPKAV